MKNVINKYTKIIIIILIFLLKPFLFQNIFEIFKNFLLSTRFIFTRTIFTFTQLACARYLHTGIFKISMCPINFVFAQAHNFKLLPNVEFSHLYVILFSQGKLNKITAWFHVHFTCNPPLDFPQYQNHAQGIKQRLPKQRRG